MRLSLRIRGAVLCRSYSGEVLPYARIADVLPERWGATWGVSVPRAGAGAAAANGVGGPALLVELLLDR